MALRFVLHRTCGGRTFRMLNAPDEFIREGLAIRVRRELSSIGVIDVLADLAHLERRSRPESAATMDRSSSARLGPE